jgi:putative aldouronate transport system substrate-binding protein
MKRTISVLAASTMLVSLLSACGGSGQEPKKIDVAASPSDSGKPEVIKVFMGGGAKFPDGEDINKNPWTELIEKENNIDLQIEYGPSATDEYMNKLTLKFASNDIPDLFILPGNAQSQSWLMQNAELGALMNLDGKIDKFSNLKNAIYPSALEAVKYKGKPYAVPVLNDGNKATDNVYIRKDWLDKLKLEIPKTLEDYEKVAKAFRDQDPDGNGKPDTSAMIAYDNMLGWSHLFGAFGVFPGYWIEKDGKMVNSDIQPEMKEALTYLNKLYKEKLLDNEWPVMKIKAYNEKVANNQSGFYEKSWAATRDEINTSKQKDPKAQWIPIAPPVGPSGKSGISGSADYKSMAVISGKAKNADAILKMLDWMAVPANIDKFVFGFGDKGEGFMYTMKDGKYMLNFENHNKYGYRQQLMFMQPKELNKKKMEALGPEFDLVAMIEHSVKYGIPNKFTGAPTPAMVESASTLDQLRTERFTKIIVGQLPVTAFDDFVKEYNAKGGEKIAMEVNNWYKETKK